MAHIKPFESFIFEDANAELQKMMTKLGLRSEEELDRYLAAHDTIDSVKDYVNALPAVACFKKEDASKLSLVQSLLCRLFKCFGTFGPSMLSNSSTYPVCIVSDSKDVYLCCYPHGIIDMLTQRAGIKASEAASMLNVPEENFRTAVSKAGGVCPA